MNEKQLATPPEKAIALTIAQNLIKSSGQKMTHNQLKAIHNFIGKLNNSTTRNKVTIYDCQKIVNTAKTFS